MNSFIALDVKKLNEESPFVMLGDRWALLTAGTVKDWNTMTVSWGQMGVLWNMNVATVYVRPQRHTLKYMDANDYFTLSFFDKEYRPALAFCGKYSGRDVDKAKETGLTPIFADGSVAFSQAETILVCRKLYRQQLTPLCFLDTDVEKRNYKCDHHFAYTGQIVAAYRKVR
jgi:flavin reductase (DIM6/NTAB) family NADH-FMN oxidoreductase RutF